MENYIKSKYRSKVRLRQKPQQQKHQQYNYRNLKQSNFHRSNLLTYPLFQYPLWARQRLIPLTSEIRKVIMEFRYASSDVSLPEKRPIFYNTLSITSMVRAEVHNMLHELAVTDNFIRKEEIDDLIEKCLKEKVTVLHEGGDSGNSTAPADSNVDLLPQDIEVTVEMLNENDKNKLIVENFQILEQRITTLEDRLSSMLQNIPKIRHFQAAKFKINTNAIKEELRSIIDRIDLRLVPKQNDQIATIVTATTTNVENDNDKVTSEEENISASLPSSSAIREPPTATAVTTVAPVTATSRSIRQTVPVVATAADGNVPSKVIETTAAPELKRKANNGKKVAKCEPNIHYDDLYYAGRQYAINLLSYKKSSTSLELNEHAKLNPYIKPEKFVLPPSKETPKRKPRFIDPDNFQ